MPSKKKKYNARFPAGRIKKIMQSDEEIGKVAQAVPVIISRTLELFVESMLTKTLKITNSRNAKTLSTSHMKQCIMSEQRFDFLRELVKNIPDISVAEEAANYNEEDAQSSPEEQYPDSDTPFDLSMPSTSTRASSSSTSRNGNAETCFKRANTFNGTPTHGIRFCLPEPVKKEELRREINKYVNTAPFSLAAAREKLAREGCSVIKHTDSIANADNSNALPPKLARSDSTPAASLVNKDTDLMDTWEKRLYIKEKIVPMRNCLTRCDNELEVEAINSNKTARKEQSRPQPSQLQTLKQQQQLQLTPLQQKQTQQQHKQYSYSPQSPPQTAIPAPTPAPIVSFDFCNKPVVKIDYSNLPLTPSAAAIPRSYPLHAQTSTAAAVTAPLSAPANIALAHTTNTAFNFNIGEPVINIDLSNMVTNVMPPTAAADAMSTATPNITAPVATISIGTIPIAAAGLTSSSSLLSHPAHHKTMPIAAAALNSKKASTAGINAVLPSPPIINHPKAAMPFSNTNNNKNSYFELDEDYDNI